MPPPVYGCHTPTDSCTGSQALLLRTPYNRYRRRHGAVPACPPLGSRGVLGRGLSLTCPPSSFLFAARKRVQFSLSLKTKQTNKNTTRRTLKKKRKIKLSRRAVRGRVPVPGSRSLSAGASRPSAAGTRLGQGPLAPRIWDLLRSALLPPGPRGEARGSPAEPCPAPAAEHPALPEASAPVLGVQPALGAARPGYVWGKAAAACPAPGAPAPAPPYCREGAGALTGGQKQGSGGQHGMRGRRLRHADQEPSR